MGLLDFIIDFVKEDGVNYDGLRFYESSTEISGVSRFFYEMFLSSEENFIWYINRYSSRQLRDVLPYINDKNFKEDIYNCLRRKVFIGETQSFILKEIFGLLDFVKRINEYRKITKEMRNKL